MFCLFKNVPRDIIVYEIQPKTVLAKNSYLGLRSLVCRMLDMSRPNSLERAADAGCAQVVRLLLDENKDNPLQETETTPAVKAAYGKSHTSVLDALLSDERLIIPPDLVASMLVFSFESPKWLSWLLTKPTIDPSVGDNQAIRMAAAHGFTNAVNILLSDGRVDPSAKNNYAILFASSNGNTDAVRLLLSDHRIDVSVCGSHALQMACTNKHVQTLKVLLADARIEHLVFQRFPFLDMHCRDATVRAMLESTAKRALQRRRGH